MIKSSGSITPTSLEDNVISITRNIHQDEPQNEERFPGLYDQLLLIKTRKTGSARRTSGQISQPLLK